MLRNRKREVCTEDARGARTQCNHGALQGAKSFGSGSTHHLPLTYATPLQAKTLATARVLRERPQTQVAAAYDAVHVGEDWPGCQEPQS